MVVVHLLAYVGSFQGICGQFILCSVCHRHKCGISIGWSIKKGILFDVSVSVLCIGYCWQRLGDNHSGEMQFLGHTHLHWSG